MTGGVDPDRIRRSLDTVRARFGVDPQPPGGAPVFLLASGWRGGSTLVQRLLVSSGELLMWGEPYDNSAIIRRMAETLAPIDESWPPNGYIVSDANLPTSDRWIANAYPHPRHLMAAHREFFDRLFAVPARELGHDRWGLKGVRLQGGHAGYLRGIYPDAVFVMLHRNPYDAFLSYRLLHEIRPNSFWWYHRWPDDQVSDARRFGEIWRELTESFLTWGPRLGAVVLAYEDLLRGRGLDEMAKATGLSIDRSVLDARVGGTRDQRGEWDGARAELDDDEIEAIRATTGAVARSLGYVGPTGSSR